MEWFELEGTFKGHLVALPCNEQEHPQLHQRSEPCPALPPGMGHPPPLCVELTQACLHFAFLIKPGQSSGKCNDLVPFPPHAVLEVIPWRLEGQTVPHH